MAAPTPTRATLVRGTVVANGDRIADRHETLLHRHERRRDAGHDREGADDAPVIGPPRVDGDVDLRPALLTDDLDVGRRGRAGRVDDVDAVLRFAGIGVAVDERPAGPPRQPLILDRIGMQLAVRVAETCRLDRLADGPGHGIQDMGTEPHGRRRPIEV